MDLMELATGGGSSASAFGGMGRGEVVEREKGAPGTELTAWKRGGEWLVFGSMIGVSLSLKELGGRREGGGKGGGVNGRRGLR